MTAEEIKECNKLIAKFMGIKIRAEYPTDVDLEMGQDEHMSIWARYEESWDWLMPVWIKIKSTLIGNVQSGSFLHEGRIKKGLENADINYVWENIVKFIEWYNKEYNPTNT